MAEAVVVGVSLVIIPTATTVFGEAECAVDVMRLQKTDIGARWGRLSNWTNLVVFVIK
jgi:hypothetical protein